MRVLDKLFCWRQSITHYRCRFGIDSYPIILDDVTCSTSNYLVILQCSFSTVIESNCVNGRDDVSVTCCEFILMNSSHAKLHKWYYNYFYYLQQIPLKYGATHTMVWYNSLMAALSMRVWWRCTAMDSGALCVMMVLILLMLTQCANSWGTQEHLATTMALKCELMMIDREIQWSLH